jgi:hypothetical protein
MGIMNLRNWSIAHTKGLLVGILSPLIFIPIVIFLLAWLQDFHFSRLWYMFETDEFVRSKVVSIAIISNLIWFYLSLNREKYSFGMGVIIGTICYLPYILYVNFLS